MAWTYGVVGLGDRDKKTLDAHRRKGVAICYRRNGDKFEVWQYAGSTWIPIPERSIDFVRLCELIGEKAPGNRWLSTRKAGLGRLPEAKTLDGMIAPGEAALKIGKSPTRIYRWIQAGAPAYAADVAGGKRIRVRLGELMSWAIHQGFLQA